MIIQNLTCHLLLIGVIAKLSAGKIPVKKNSLLGNCQWRNFMWQKLSLRSIGIINLVIKILLNNEEIKRALENRPRLVNKATCKQVKEYGGKYKY